MVKSQDDYKDDAYIAELRQKVKLTADEMLSSYHKTANNPVKEEYKMSSKHPVAKRFRNAYHRQANFNDQFKHNPLVVAVDPSLLSVDEQVKFKILDMVSLRKFKKEIVSKYEQPITDAQISKLKPTEYMNSLNAIGAEKLALKNKCPPKGTAYSLNKRTIFGKHVGTKQKKEGVEVSDMKLTYLDFKKYVSDFDRKIKEQKNKFAPMIEKINVNKQKHEKIEAAGSDTSSIYTEDQSNCDSCSDDTPEE